MVSPEFSCRGLELTHSGVKAGTLGLPGGHVVRGVTLFGASRCSGSHVVRGVTLFGASRCSGRQGVRCHMRLVGYVVSWRRETRSLRRSDSDRLCADRF